MRTREKEDGTKQKSRLFQVKRWRLNESEDFYPQESSLASESVTIVQNTPRTCPDTSPSTAQQGTIIVRASQPSAPVRPTSLIDPQPFMFPLSLDHLLHLIQYNVFRAFITNKRTLNTLPSDPLICSINGPYCDDTTANPLNPNMPSSLVPTTLQQTRYHGVWINVIPFPRIRDNLIKYEGCYDRWELMQDLVGESLTTAPAYWRGGTSVVESALQSKQLVSFECDTDEITAGRNGLIVWGEPHEMQNWELTPGFLAKWAWAVEGCEELIEISNYWRMQRGEEPMQFSLPESYVLPSLSHPAFQS